MNEEIRTNMIYDYFRWFHWPRLTYRKVEPVDNIQKEFSLEKREEPEQESLEEQTTCNSEKDEDQPKRKRLSIWV